MAIEGSTDRLVSELLPLLDSQKMQQRLGFPSECFNILEAGRQSVSSIPALKRHCKASVNDLQSSYSSVYVYVRNWILDNNSSCRSVHVKNVNGITTSCRRKLPFRFVMIEIRGRMKSMILRKMMNSSTFDIMHKREMGL